MDRFDKAEERAVLNVVRSGNLSPFFRNSRGGPRVQEFEEAFARFVGVKHAIAVSNGTAALHVALQSVGITGETVDTTVASFVASATSIIMAGAHNIVWHDIDPGTYNIAASEELELASYIVAVDLLGHPIDIDGLRSAAPNALIIEDAAQAIRSSYRDRRCGSLGDIATFSFQETKTITTGGEGGMVVTNNDVWAEKARLLRNHGIQYGDADFLCYNYRMTELQAAFGLAQLKKVDDLVNEQTANAGYIRDHLPRGLHMPFLPDYAKPNYYIIGCTFNELEAGMPRDVFLEQLEERGVDHKIPGRTVGPGYQLLIHERPFFQKRTPTRKQFPVAEELKKTWVWLDIHRWRSLDMIKKDIDIMHEILE